MKLFSLWALLILWGLTLFSPVVYSQKIDYQGFPEWSWQEEGECEYMLYTPSSLTEGEKYPLAVFLHGEDITEFSGGRFEDDISLISITVK